MFFKREPKEEKLGSKASHRLNDGRLTIILDQEGQEVAKIVFDGRSTITFTDLVSGESKVFLADDQTQQAMSRATEETEETTSTEVKISVSSKRSIKRWTTPSQYRMIPVQQMKLPLIQALTGAGLSQENAQKVTEASSEGIYEMLEVADSKLLEFDQIAVIHAVNAVLGGHMEKEKFRTSTFLIYLFHSERSE